MTLNSLEHERFPFRAASVYRSYRSVAPAPCLSAVTTPSPRPRRYWRACSCQAHPPPSVAGSSSTSTRQSRVRKLTSGQPEDRHDRRRDGADQQQWRASRSTRSPPLTNCRQSDAQGRRADWPPVEGRPRSGSKGHFRHYQERPDARPRPPSTGTRCTPASATPPPAVQGRRPNSAVGLSRNQPPPHRLPAAPIGSGAEAD